MLRRHLAVEAATEAMKQYKSGLVCQFTEDGGEDNNITPCYDVIINNIMSASVCEYVFSGRKMCSVSAGLCVYVCDRSVSISRFFHLISASLLTERTCGRDEQACKIKSKGTSG